MKITRHLLTLSLTLTLVSSAHAGWKLPIKVENGGTIANAAIGMESGATSGYDAGRDVPVPEDTSTITAYFSHPEWGVTVAGKSLVDFYQEIRGESYPAEWKLEIDITASSSHTMTWTKPDPLPKGLSLYLYPPSGSKVDMLTTNSYTFTPSSSNTFPIQASVTGTTPPLSPTISKVTPQDSSLLLEWAGTDPDTAGYKVHFGAQSGNYDRTIDVKEVTNLTIKKLENGKTYYVAVTAYNKTGTESSYSAESQETPAAQVKYYSISGKVSDSRKKGIAGITVTISTDPAAKVTTDSDGSYTFTDIASGIYTVTPSMSVKDRFSPPKKDITLDSKDVTNAHFTLRGRR